MATEIGIIGGSGFYSLLDDAQDIEVENEYGKPSDKISLGKIAGKGVAFIPRHGKGHTISPHLVPYRANIEALSKLGVKRIISTGAVGSLNPEFKVGQLVIFDQFMNMTHGRIDTFFDKNQVVHVSTADPYCPGLRAKASDAAKSLNLDYKRSGSVVVISGPRFSTRAESKFFSKQGFDTINMTQYPEAALVREKGICYLGIGIVTDYDAGLIGEGGVEPVTYDQVAKAFSQNVDNVKSLISKIISTLPDERACRCGSALDSATIKL